jgi:hypothetical protein
MCLGFVSLITLERRAQLAGSASKAAVLRSLTAAQVKFYVVKAS